MEIFEWVTKLNVNANDDTHDCSTLHDTNVNDNICGLRDTSQCVHLKPHPLSVVRILSGRLSCLHLHTLMHLGSSLSLSCHLMNIHVRAVSSPGSSLSNSFSTFRSFSSSSTLSVLASDELLLSTSSEEFEEIRKTGISN